MKYIFRLLLLPLLAMTALTGCDDDKDVQANEVPLAYKTALSALYPDAVSVEWERDGGYYVADFNRMGHDYEVWLGNEATWAMTEIDNGNTLEGLPSGLIVAFANSAYGYVPDYTLDQVKEYQRPSGTFYVIEVEPNKGGADVYLFYDKDGTLLRTSTVDVDIRPDFSI